MQSTNTNSLKTIEDVDELALFQSEVMLETLKNSIEWSIADIELSGDDYYNLRDYAIHRAIIFALDNIHLDEPDDLRKVIADKLKSYE